jgi:endonuclease/exonuclease/phosphatase family metal-dependent hydrolase
MLFSRCSTKFLRGSTSPHCHYRNIRISKKNIDLLDGFHKLEAPKEQFKAPELRVDTVFVGKEFELQVIQVLSRFGMKLKVCSYFISV